MRGNGESKLCVKESKLCSWNCCWCSLCEGAGEVPPAPGTCRPSRHGHERERMRMESRELARDRHRATALVAGTWVLLPSKRWWWVRIEHGSVWRSVHYWDDKWGRRVHRNYLKQQKKKHRDAGQCDSWVLSPCPT